LNIFIKKISSKYSNLIKTQRKVNYNRSWSFQLKILTILIIFFTSIRIQLNNFIAAETWQFDILLKRFLLLKKMISKYLFKINQLLNLQSTKFPFRSSSCWVYKSTCLLRKLFGTIFHRWWVCFRRSWFWRKWGWNPGKKSGTFELKEWLFEIS
jgi:hypothetical protein